MSLLNDLREAERLCEGGRFSGISPLLLLYLGVVEVVVLRIVPSSSVSVSVSVLLFPSTGSKDVLLCNWLCSNKGGDDGDDDIEEEDAVDGSGRRAFAGDDLLFIL